MYLGVLVSPEAYWVTVPKCASNSIRRAIGGRRHSIAAPMDDRPKYCVVRNPRERFVSALAFYQVPEYSRFLSYGEWKMVTKETTPEEMIDMVEQGNDGDVHFRPQVKFIPEGVKLFKLETKIWCDVLGYEPVVLNKGSHLSSEDWCDKETLDRIDKYYAKDWEIWESAE